MDVVKWNTLLTLLYWNIVWDIWLWNWWHFGMNLKSTFSKLLNARLTVQNVSSLCTILARQVRAKDLKTKNRNTIIASFDHSSSVFVDSVSALKCKNWLILIFGVMQASFCLFGYLVLISLSWWALRRTEVDPTSVRTCPVQLTIWWLKDTKISHLLEPRLSIGTRSRVQFWWIWWRCRQTDSQLNGNVWWMSYVIHCAFSPLNHCRNQFIEQLICF